MTPEETCDNCCAPTDNEPLRLCDDCNGAEAQWFAANTRERDELRAALSALKNENARLREALTPSGETKAAFIGEFQFAVESDVDDSMVTVPWTTVKEIMAAILAHALASSTGEPQ